jgi:hypothetical protein
MPPTGRNSPAPRSWRMIGHEQVIPIYTRDPEPSARSRTPDPCRDLPSPFSNLKSPICDSPTAPSGSPFRVFRVFRGSTSLRLLRLFAANPPITSRPSAFGLPSKTTLARHLLIWLRVPPLRPRSNSTAVMRGVAVRVKCAVLGELPNDLCSFPHPLSLPR